MLFDPCPAIVDIFMAEISLSYCFGLRIFDCEQMSCSSCIMGILYLSSVHVIFIFNSSIFCIIRLKGRLQESPSIHLKGHSVAI